VTAPISDASIYTDVAGLAAVKRGVQAQDPKALREAAQQFESLFTRMMLKSMREASFGDPVFGSDQEKFYQGMFDDQMAVNLSRGHGLGLGDMLVRQLTRAGLIPADTADSSTASSSAAGAPAGTSAVSPAGSSASPSAAAAGTNSTAQTAAPLSQADFINAVWPAAQAAGRELGVDPRSLVAQAALETGWGRSIPSDVSGSSSFNLFGVKTGEQWSGPSVAVRTLEFEGGLPVPRTDKFRAYSSPNESFNDYVALLRDNPRYADALNTGSDTQAFANALQRGGYATDPAYAQKLTAIAQNVDGMTTTLKSADARPLNATTSML
jgi:flagellar protein FlgJ